MLDTLNQYVNYTLRKNNNYKRWHRKSNWVTKGNEMEKNYQ